MENLPRLIDLPNSAHIKQTTGNHAQDSEPRLICWCLSVRFLLLFLIHLCRIKFSSTIHEDFDKILVEPLVTEMALCCGQITRSSMPCSLTRTV